jgi:hypothetical protein
LIEAGRHLPFQEALGDNSPLIAFIFDYLSTTAPQFFFASQTEDLYPEDTTPYGEMLLFTMSFFPGLDQVASGIDFFRSLAAGDVAGAILSGLDFVTPGSVRAIGNALGYSDEALGIIGRNADEAGGAGNSPLFAPGVTYVDGVEVDTEHWLQFGYRFDNEGEIVQNSRFLWWQANTGARLEQLHDIQLVPLKNNDPAMARLSGDFYDPQTGMAYEAITATSGRYGVPIRDASAFLQSLDDHLQRTGYNYLVVDVTEMTPSMRQEVYEHVFNNANRPEYANRQDIIWIPPR